jgi:hypothetical protein
MAVTACPSLPDSCLYRGNGLADDGVNGRGAIISHGPLNVTRMTSSGGRHRAESLAIRHLT